MTRDEWLTATDPAAMLDWLRDSGKLSERRARLFAVAVCRRIWPAMTDDRARRAVEVAERYADEKAELDELHDVYHDAAAAANAVFFAVYDAAEAEATALDLPDCWISGAHECAGEAAAALKAAASAAALDHDELGEAAGHAISAAAHAASPILFTEECRPDMAKRSAAEEGERAAQATLLRDLVAPFRTAAFDPAWRTPEVLALALEMYDSRDFSRVAALARLLEDQGCRDAELLEHLKGPGPHAKGCWAVDEVLSRKGTTP